MIITGGEKVWPAEVESLLLIHPKVMDAVVGVPDDEWGQVVCAVIVAGPESAIGPEAVRGFVRDRRPTTRRRRVLSVEKIPRECVGEPGRKNVAELLRERR